MWDRGLRSRTEPAHRWVERGSPARLRSADPALSYRVAHVPTVALAQPRGPGLEPRAGTARAGRRRHRTPPAQQGVPGPAVGQLRLPARRRAAAGVQAVLA